MARDGDILVCTNGLAVDIYDISTPGQHILLKRLLSDPTAVFISEGLLYIAEYSVGLHIYSLSDPSSPVLLATSPSGNYFRSVGLSGDLAYVCSISYSGAIYATETSNLEIVDCTFLNNEVMDGIAAITFPGWSPSSPAQTFMAIVVATGLSPLPTFWTRRAT